MGWGLKCLSEKWGIGQLRVKIWIVRCGADEQKMLWEGWL